MKRRSRLSMLVMALLLIQQLGGGLIFAMGDGVGETLDTENVSSENIETPAEETETPAEETETPAEETETPAEETEAPVKEETEAPVEGTETSAEETEAPVEGTETSAEETEAPVKEETTETPAEETETPAEEELETMNLRGGVEATPESCFTFAEGTITKYLKDSAPECGTDVVIPAEIDGVAVTSIGNQAFQYNQLTSVNIPDSVTSIGNGAFVNNKRIPVIGIRNKGSEGISVPYDANIEITKPNQGCFKFENGEIQRYYGGVFPECTTDVIIPAEIDGVAVTSIGNSAFANNRLTSVIIPEGVTSIGDYAFYNNKLTSVIIPNGVISIGGGAFYDNQLTSVIIPNGVISIGGGAFANNQLTSINIPNGVISIGDYAFYNNKLTSVIIPEGATSIGNQAFQGNQLTSVIIPNSVTSIGNQAFNNNQLPDDQAFIYARNPEGGEDKTQIIGYGGKKREGILIPESVTSIGNSAFANNQLTWLNIPDSVTSIGHEAFANNKRNPVIGIRSKGSEGIDTSRDPYIEITKPNQGCFRLENGEIQRYYGGVFPECTTDMIIPTEIDGVAVTSIAPRAFRNNQLTSAIIPDGVTSIGYQAFYDNQLTSVSIPNSITSIGGEAFRNNKLTSVSIPNSITSIGGEAFRNNKLTSVIIPESVTSIGDGAFYDNPNPAVLYTSNLNKHTIRDRTNVLVNPHKIKIIPLDEQGKTIPIKKDSFLYGEEGVRFLLRNTEIPDNPNPDRNRYIFVYPPNFSGYLQDSLKNKGILEEYVISGEENQTISLYYLKDHSSTPIPTDTAPSYAGGGGSYLSPSSKEESKQEVNIPTKNQGSLTDITTSFENTTQQLKISSSSLFSAPLTRGKLAEFVLALDQLGIPLKKPQANTDCDFDDSNLSEHQQQAMRKTCERGVMGIHSVTREALSTFGANQSVTKADFATVMTRMLFGYEYEKANESYYQGGFEVFKKLGLFENNEQALSTISLKQALKGFLLYTSMIKNS